ncbi:COG1086 Predicted nucleoside-diphosphate sugar epimerases [Candidatus Nanopelagicaceae bacterium]
MKSSLKAATVTITGGTGSFGKTMVKNLLLENVDEVRVFSRDENKQDQMRKEFDDTRLKFILGDVRDFSSVESAIRGSNFVFHAAALKQVPSCEFFPMQAVATNISGSSNVLDASIKFDVETVVCLSSDKAVYPINAMGMTKALMEKVAQSYSRNSPKIKTRIAITRYGNVMMSRGSVIPLFLDQIASNKPITITNPEMTRFMMSLEDSVELVKHAFTDSSNGDLFVKKAPACSVATLAESVIRLMGVEERIEIKNIGTRHGEKLFESLLSVEERVRAVDQGEFFKIPLDTRSLDYQAYFEKGQELPLNDDESYNSHNTNQLSVEEVAILISNLSEFIAYREMNNL